MVDDDVEASAGAKEDETLAGREVALAESDAALERERRVRGAVEEETCDGTAKQASGLERDATRYSEQPSVCSIC